MDDSEQLVSLHATMVDTACASETKRQNVSVVSAGLISAGITIFAADKGFSFSYLSIPILILSSIWFVTVRFYQQLAKAKWAVVQEMESRLVYQPFTREWEIHNAGKGKFTFGPSIIEQIIPGTIFISTLIYIVFWAIHKIYS